MRQQKTKSQRAIAKNKINYEEIPSEKYKIFGRFVRFVCGVDVADAHLGTTTYNILAGVAATLCHLAWLVDGGSDSCSLGNISDVRLCEAYIRG